MVTPLADGTLDICCVCTPEDPGLKWSQPPTTELPGLHSHDYDLGNGLQQIFVADDWICPDCAMGKEDFDMVEI